MPSMKPVGVDFVDRASEVVTTEIDIDASIEEVWAALVDNDGWVDWFGCSRCVASPTVWSAVGDRRSVTLGALKIDEVAVELTDPSVWAMTFVRTNVPLWTAALEMVELFDTSREGERRTELRWTGAFDFHWFARPLSKLVLARAADSWGQGFEDLAEYLRSRR